jgi:hypothetical protein
MNTINIISIILAILCFITILLIGVITNILREAIIPPKIPETNDKIPEPVKKKAYSFSRFQLWLWTLIIGPRFVLNWGFVNDMQPEVAITSLILLGIPASVAVTAAGITLVQMNLKNNLPEYKKKFIHLKSEIETKGFWTDILIDDYGQFSIVRLQQLIFTFAYVVIYISLFFYCDMENPEFDNSAYILMGISSGTYLIGKGVNK